MVGAEILLTEDLHQGVMVVMLHQDALLTVMFGGVVELQVEEEEVVQIGLHPEEVAAIVTLDLEEEQVVIATLAPEIQPAVTPPGPETTDPPTGVKVRLAVEESGAPRLEMRDPERDQLENLKTAGPKSSVDQFPFKTLFWGEFLYSVEILANPSLNV